MRNVMRSRSWSEICRDRVNHYIYVINNNDGSSYACIQWAKDNISNSYRPLIFKYRTAKLFGRAVRKGKVKESRAAAESYRCYINKIAKTYSFIGR